MLDNSSKINSLKESSRIKTKYDKTYDYVHDVQKSGQEEKAGIRENVSDAPTPYPVENARHNYAVDNGNPQGLKLVAAMADKPVQRTSLKEKLEAFKVKAAGGDAEKAMPKKAKEKAETL